MEQIFELLDSIDKISSETDIKKNEFFEKFVDEIGSMSMSGLPICRMRPPNS